LDNNGDPAMSKILLISEMSIRSYEHLESGFLGGTNQFAVQKVLQPLSRAVTTS